MIRIQLPEDKEWMLVWQSQHMPMTGHEGRKTKDDFHFKFNKALKGRSAGQEWLMSSKAMAMAENDSQDL